MSVAFDRSGSGSSEAERLALQEAVDRLRAQCEAARDARALAHELGNLVGIVRGAAALISEGVGDATDWALQIEAAMDAAAGVVDRLRRRSDFAPAEGPIDLRAPLARAAELLRARSGAARQARLDLPAAPVPALAEDAAVTTLALDLALSTRAGAIRLAAAPGAIVLRFEGGDAGDAFPEIAAPLLDRAGCRLQRGDTGLELHWSGAASIRSEESWS